MKNQLHFAKRSTYLKCIDKYQCVMYSFKYQQECVSLFFFSLFHCTLASKKIIVIYYMKKRDILYESSVYFSFAAQADKRTDRITISYTLAAESDKEEKSKRMLFCTLHYRSLVVYTYRRILRLIFLSLSFSFSQSYIMKKKHHDVRCEKNSITKSLKGKCGGCGPTLFLNTA